MRIKCEVQLRLLEDQYLMRQARLERLRKDVGTGIKQIKQGKYTDYDEKGLDKLLKEIKSKGRKQLGNKTS